MCIFFARNFRSVWFVVFLLLLFVCLFVCAWSCVRYEYVCCSVLFFPISFCFSEGSFVCARIVFQLANKVKSLTGYIAIPKTNISSDNNGCNGSHAKANGNIHIYIEKFLWLTNCKTWKTKTNNVGSIDMFTSIRRSSVGNENGSDTYKVIQSYGLGK